MDERVEAFLADVLALEGDEANAIRERVRGALADYSLCGCSVTYCTSTK
jgi:hypothetical protein